MKCSCAKKQRLAGAIRPLEVAAILCVLGVLAFVGWLGLGHFRERALRVHCGNNLSRIGQSLEAYAKDNRGELPDCSGADPRYSQVGWPWNMETNLVNELTAKGLSREVFFCPANSGMNDDRHWNFYRTYGGTTRVIGYAMLFRGTTTVPANSWVSKLESKESGPSRKELGFDATAGIGEDYTRIQGLWTDRSNHMRELTPLGGNVLFADEHVDWRGFSEMQMRFHTLGPGGVIDWYY